MSQFRIRVWAGVMAFGISCGWSALAQAAPQKGKEPPRFGNGAFLKRIFGGSNDQAQAQAADRSKRPAQQNSVETTADKAKASWDQARNATREGWEAGRQRLKADSDKLRERLGFKSGEEEAESAANDAREVLNRGREAANVGREPAVAWRPDRSEEAANRPAEPRSKFAPQAGSRSSISDQAERGVVARSASDRRPITDRSGSGEVVARPGPIGGSLGDNDRMPGPVNQPRVPAAPTYAPAANLSRSVVVAADALPVEAKFGAFGALAAPATPAGSGLLLKAVRPKSVAAQLGLLPGDVITNVAGISVDFIEEIDSLVEVLEAEDEFDLTFQRGGKSQSKSFRMPPR